MEGHFTSTLYSRFYWLGMEEELVDPLNGVLGEVKQEALEEVIEMVRVEIEVGINLKQKFDRWI